LRTGFPSGLGRQTGCCTDDLAALGLPAAFFDFGVKSSPKPSTSSSREYRLSGLQTSSRQWNTGSCLPFTASGSLANLAVGPPAPLSQSSAAITAFIRSSAILASVIGSASRYPAW